MVYEIQISIADALWKPPAIHTLTDTQPLYVYDEGWNGENTGETDFIIGSM